ncbi:MAG: hypothetical protein ACRBCK_07180 [Alphaproteobacteria bacterium]
MPTRILPEKTLFDVLRDVWRAKYYMTFAGFVFVILGILFMSLAQDFYRAEMIIAPARPMGQGLAAVAHAGEGSIQVQREDFQSNAAFVRFENIYDGVSVASILMADKDVLSALAFDRPFEFSKGRLSWDAQTLSEYVSRRVVLEPVSGTSLRRLVYLHPDRKFAAHMIGQVHRISDEIIRARLLREANGRIDYLHVGLSNVTNPEHRKSLTVLLMEQERLKMMVSLDEPYAASIIEPPSVSSRPRWPDPYLVYPVFVFIGLFLGFVIYGLRHHD